LIVTFLSCNRLGFTKATISSFIGHNKGAKDFTWVALDNGSTDGTKEYLKRKGIFTEIIDLPKNIGLHPGMKELFKRAIEIGKGEEYILHLENDFWSSRSAAIPTALSVMDEMSKVGTLQLRDLEEEYEQIRQIHMPWWNDEKQTINHIVKVQLPREDWWNPDDEDEAVGWDDEFEKDDRRYRLSDYPWCNGPAITRTSIAKKLLGDLKIRDKFNEYYLRVAYYKMGHKTIRDLPGSFNHIGYANVGGQVHRTEGRKFL